MASILDRVAESLAGAAARRGTRARDGRSPEHRPHSYISLVDLGTSSAKAMVLAYQRLGEGTAADDPHPAASGESRALLPVVLGLGTARYAPGHLRGAAIRDLSGVVATCERALVQAEDRARVVPRRVVFGINGELAHAHTSTLGAERARLDDAISEAELFRLRNLCQRQAIRELRRSVAWQRIATESRPRLLHADLLEMEVDGHAVATAVGLRGERLRLTMAHAFVDECHVQTVQRLAQELDLELAGLIFEPHALARSVAMALPDEFGVICVDVGGATTDVSLVRQGMLFGTRSIPIGGHALTRGIADELGAAPDEAEELKIRYASGSLDGQTARSVRTALDRDVATLLAAAELALEELAGGSPLPARICLCGGGSLLPDVGRRLVAELDQRRLSFVRRPGVTAFRAGDVQDLGDHSAVLRGSPHAALAAVASEWLRQRGAAAVGDEEPLLAGAAPA